MPAISVIVPSYKAEHTIERCVNSLRCQTFTDIEIILVDDGSPDNTGSMCDAFAKEDPRIRVIHKPNGGISSARNAGLDLASGRYLMFCDSDDYAAPDWCRWMYDAMSQENTHLAICAVASVTDDKITKTFGVGALKRVKPNQFLEIVLSTKMNESWNKGFRIDVIRKYKLRFDENLQRCEDVLFILEYLKHIAPDDLLCYGSPVLYHYVYSGPESLSRIYVKDYLKLEQEVLSQYRAVMHQFGIPAEVYQPWYSEHAALLMINIIANILMNKKASPLSLVRQLGEVVTCDDFDQAIRYGGLDKVTVGKYLQILKKKNPWLLYCYHTMSSIKNHLHR